MSARSNSEVVVRQRWPAAVILGSAALLLALAWALLLQPGSPGSAAPDSSTAMATPDMANLHSTLPAADAWSLDHLLATYTMWLTMMLAMMTPALVPLALTYAIHPRLVADSTGQVTLALWLSVGYLGTWACYALVATLGQSAVQALQLMSPQLSFTNPELGGAVLIVVGLNQWLPLKHDCLGYCSVPQSIIDDHGGFPIDNRAALRHGLLAGAYCVGCCWALMAVLFVFGIMNLACIALLTLVILAEHLAPVGPRIARLAGVACIAGGAWLMTGLGS